MNISCTRWPKSFISNFITIKKRHVPFQQISTSLPLSTRIRVEHFSRLLRRTWRLVGRKSRREGDEKEKERRRILPVLRRSPRCRLDVSRAGRKSWISIRASTADDTSGRAKRRGGDDGDGGDGASEMRKVGGSPPVSGGGEESLPERYPGSCRPAGESSRRARDRDQLAPLSFPPPTIKRHQHRRHRRG